MAVAETLPSGQPEGSEMENKRDGESVEDQSGMVYYHGKPVQPHIYQQMRGDTLLLSICYDGSVAHSGGSSYTAALGGTGE